MHKHTNFFICWEEDPLKVATRHPEKDMWQFEDHIVKYLATLPMRMSDSPGGRMFSKEVMAQGPHRMQGMPLTKPRDAVCGA